MNTSAEDRIIAYLSGNMSTKEKTAFEQELVSSSALENEFESYQVVWHLTNQLNYSQDVSDASWENFQRKVKAPFTILGLDWLKVAASIILLAAISFGMWFFGSTDINLTTVDAISDIELADESTVRLDYNSNLTYDKSFDSDNREVTLSGQAYFEVMPSNEKFTINCEVGEVVVHGTEFSLFTSSTLLALELYEGSVSYILDGKETFVKPNQRLLVEDGVINISEFTSPSIWSEVISCSDAPLAYILEQLKLTYSVEYKVPRDALKERYTVSLPKDDITRCVQILSKISGQNFALINNTIVIK